MDVLDCTEVEEMHLKGHCVNSLGQLVLNRQAQVDSNTAVTIDRHIRDLSRMKILPVVIVAKYLSSVQSAVSERPNSSTRLVS